MRSPAQEAFDALSDPTRRRILQHLAEHDEVTAGEIAEQVGGVTRPAISSHLRVLRTSGLIGERRDGRFRYYSLAPDGPVRDALSFLQDLLGSAVPDVSADNAVDRAATSHEEAG